MTKPYYAVIFSSIQTNAVEGYEEMANQMITLAKSQPGFIGVESARETMGITVSYWRSLADIANWKANTDHLVAQLKGKSNWYKYYKVRICLVEREYEFTQ